jgi:hypothetical protein
MSNETNNTNNINEQVGQVDTELTVVDTNLGAQGAATSAQVTPEARAPKQVNHNSVSLENSTLGSLSAEAIATRGPNPESINDIIIPVHIKAGDLLKDLSSAMWYELNLVVRPVRFADLPFSEDKLFAYHKFLIAQRVKAAHSRVDRDVRYHDEGFWVHPVISMFIDQIGTVRDASLGITFVPFLSVKDVTFVEEAATVPVLRDMTDKFKAPMDYLEAKKISDELRRISKQGVIMVPYSFKYNNGGTLAFMSMTVVESHVLSLYDKQHPVYAVAASLFSRLSIYDSTGMVPRIRYGSMSYYQTLVSELADIRS